MQVVGTDKARSMLSVSPNLVLVSEKLIRRSLPVLSKVIPHSPDLFRGLSLRVNSLVDHLVSVSKADLGTNSPPKTTLYYYIYTYTFWFFTLARGFSRRPYVQLVPVLGLSRTYVY